MLDAQLYQLSRGQGVVAQVLERIFFPQRHVLVRRCMKDDVRLFARDQGFQDIGVADVDQVGADARFHPPELTRQPLAHFVKRVFRAFHECNALRLKLQHL